jgi:hypothetical protein
MYGVSEGDQNYNSQWVKIAVIANPKKGFGHQTVSDWNIVVTYEIRVFFEGAQKEVFSSILKFENVNMWNTWIRWAKRWASWA